MNNFCSNKNCYEVGKFICDRCDCERYCSKRCQLQAFPQHRFVCFKLPSLVLATENDDFASSVKIPISTQADLKNDDKEALRENIEKYCVQSKTPSPTPSHLAENSLSTQFDRPEKLSAKPQPLVKIPDENLESIENGAPTNVEKHVPIISKFAQITSKESTVSQGSLLGKSLSKFLQPKPKTRFYLSDLKSIPLPSTKFLAKLNYATVQEKVLYLLAYENAEYLLEIEKSISNYIEKRGKTASYEAEVEEVVLALFEGCYYRAVVNEKVGNKFQVHFIDFGNCDSVSEAQMMPLTKELLHDIVVQTCYIVNLPDKNPEQFVANHINEENDTMWIESALKRNQNDNAAVGDTYFAKIATP